MLQNLSRMNRVVRASGHVVFGDVVYEPGGLCGPRVQQDYQLVAVHEGDALVELDGVPLAIPERHVALMRPGRLELFVFDRARSTHHSWCAVHPSLAPESLTDALAAALAVLPLSARMQSLLDFGLAGAHQEVPAAAALLDQLGLTVLHQFLVEAQTLGRAAAVPDPVHTAQRLIAMHLSEPLTVASLARQAGVTPQHLIKLFRRALGITPAKYIWRARVQRGVELLGATGLSIEQVAAQCGFQSPFHFSRLVKQQYGRPPRALRARAWASGETSNA